MLRMARLASLVLVGWTATFAIAADPAPLDDRPAEKTGFAPELKRFARAQVIWEYDSTENGGLSDAAAANGFVYFGDDRGNVFGFTAKHGKRVWHHEGSARVFFPPTSDGERLYYSTRQGVTALNASGGRLIWNVPYQGGSGKCLVLPERETVYCAGSDGWLYALNAATGDIHWKVSLVDNVPADPDGFDGNQARFENTRARPTGIASDGDTIYQSVFDQSRVVAIDANRGLIRWAYQARGWVFADAAVDERFVFFGSQDRCVYALNKKTGKLVWKQATNGRVESGIGVDAHQVYVASCDGSMYCFDKENGERHWTFATGEDGQRKAIYSAPIVTEDTIYFAASSSGRVYAVDKFTGAPVWNFVPAPGSELFSSPSTDGTRIFVKSRGGKNAILAIGADE